MRIHRFLCALDAKTLITGSCLASKEAMRMYTAMILSNMPATREAMLAARHPAGCLVASPFELPPVALVGGMTQLVRAARRQCVTLSVMPTATCVARALVASLIDEQRKRKSQPTKKRSAVAIFYNISWLGRSQPLCVKGKRLVEAANSVFFQTFKSDFLPMWYHQSAAGHRVSRLDLAQHQELHGNNPALVLCRALPDIESLRVQRLVLSGNLFGVMTLRQAAALCGKEAVDIMDMGAEDAAKMLTMARVSAQAAQVLAYNLGAQTRRMHVDAVCRRLMQPRCAGETDEQAISRLPKTATHLMLCVACRRVANACQDGSGKDCAFNEIGVFFRFYARVPFSTCNACFAPVPGVSCSMLKVDGEVADGHLRCAKRSSAALRTALHLEEESRSASCKRAQTCTDMVQFDANGMTSRLRRDVRAVYDQTGAALACGDQPLVTVRVVGRVVGVFNQFYSLCSYCGCICTVDQNNRYGSEICCLRCDFSMLYRVRTVHSTGTPLGLSLSTHAAPSPFHSCVRGLACLVYFCVFVRAGQASTRGCE
jgi:hypothetical protein